MLPTSFWEYVSRSTLKREVAVVFLVWWLAVGTYLMMRAPATQLTPDAAMVTWSGLQVVVVGFATAAFGTDWISKQTTIAGPPMNTEIKTETTVTEGSATSTMSSTQTDPHSETKP
jgi:hypothetical protein